jgi:RNA polymerase sigma-70 factor (family 1)
MEKYRLYDEKSLLELLSKNDDLAFTEIYNRYWQKVFAIAYARMQEVETAEDIVHDVFASLWTNKNVSEILSLENYLASAAKYLILYKINKKQKEREFKSTLQSPVVELQIEDALHFKRILEFVKQEVENLPEKCRFIFKSSRVDNKPVKQIAQELNISPKTVENQLNKALKHLKLAAKGFLHFFLAFLFS